MRTTLLLLATACALPVEDVLTTQKDSPPPTFTDCDAALAKAANGDLCSGFDTCVSTGSCCVEKLACSSGFIAGLVRDCSACTACKNDPQCPTGSWCVSNVCEPCPAAGSCADCDSPFVHPIRNGCATCDCGPATTACNTCASPTTCQDGAFCQQGCSGDGCCAKFCVDSGCSTADPEGCSTECGTQSCEGLCIATACRCVQSGWACTATCSAGLEQFAARCKAP